MLAVAVSVAPQIDGDAHELLQSPDQDGNADYAGIRDVLRSVRDANQEGDIKVAFVYTIRPVAGKGSDEGSLQAWEYVVDAEEEGEDKSAIGDEVEFREGEEIIPKLGQAHVDETFAEDSFGTWPTAFAPVRDSTGREVALSEWYSAMIDLIAQHCGSLEKSSGQTIISTFGAQLIDAIQERHAIEAALTMQQDFARLRDWWRKNLSADIQSSVVIHSGSVEMHAVEMPMQDIAPTS